MLDARAAPDTARATLMDERGQRRQWEAAAHPPHGGPGREKPAITPFLQDLENGGRRARLSPSRRPRRRRPSQVSAEPPAVPGGAARRPPRATRQTSELQSLMRNSYAVFCLTKPNTRDHGTNGT